MWPAKKVMAQKSIIDGTSAHSGPEAVSQPAPPWWSLGNWDFHTPLCFFGARLEYAAVNLRNIFTRAGLASLTNSRRIISEFKYMSILNPNPSWKRKASRIHLYHRSAPNAISR